MEMQQLLECESFYSKWKWQKLFKGEFLENMYSNNRNDQIPIAQKKGALYICAYVILNQYGLISFNKDGDLFLSFYPHVYSYEFII